jgi:hypothetical protein
MTETTAEQYEPEVPEATEPEGQPEEQPADDGLDPDALYRPLDAYAGTESVETIQLEERRPGSDPEVQAHPGLWVPVDAGTVGWAEARRRLNEEEIRKTAELRRKQAPRKVEVEQTEKLVAVRAHTGTWGPNGTGMAIAVSLGATHDRQGRAFDSEHPLVRSNPHYFKPIDEVFGRYAEQAS